MASCLATSRACVGCRNNTLETYQPGTALEFVTTARLIVAQAVLQQLGRVLRTNRHPNLVADRCADQRSTCSSWPCMQSQRHTGSGAEAIADHARQGAKWLGHQPIIQVG